MPSCQFLSATRSPHEIHHLDHWPGIGRLSAEALADEIVRIVNLPAGERPARSVIGFVNDNAEAVIALTEKVRIDFAHRIGIADLLTAKVMHKAGSERFASRPRLWPYEVDKTISCRIARASSSTSPPAIGGRAR